MKGKRNGFFRDAFVHLVGQFCRCAIQDGSRGRGQVTGRHQWARAAPTAVWPTGRLVRTQRTGSGGQGTDSAAGGWHLGRRIGRHVLGAGWTGDIRGVGNGSSSRSRHGRRRHGRGRHTETTQFEGRHHRFDGQGRYGRRRGSGRQDGRTYGQHGQCGGTHGGVESPTEQHQL